nr:unnamed protein product [Naegleria fowleri]
MPRGQARVLEYLPSIFNLPFEDIMLDTLDGKAKIHCWFLRYMPSGGSLDSSFLQHKKSTDKANNDEDAIFSFHHSSSSNATTSSPSSSASQGNNNSSSGDNLSQQDTKKKIKKGTSSMMLQYKKQLQYTPTIIMFHGNAGNISHRLTNARDMYRSCKCNILMVEYRGYGRSTGEPSEEGLKNDAETAIRYLLEKRSDINPNNIFIFGRSLGGAVAIFLAAKYANVIRGVIVENTFISVPKLIPSLFPYRFAVPVLQYLCINKWDNETILRSATFRNDFHRKRLNGDLPFLFISGRKDELIPPEHMDTLIEIYCERYGDYCYVKRFEEGTHYGTWLCPGYYLNLYRFIKKFRVNPPSVSETRSRKASSSTTSVKPHIPTSSTDQIHTSGDDIVIHENITLTYADSLTIPPENHHGSGHNSGTSSGANSGDNTPRKKGTYMFR